MNREILFKGKREDNGEWVYGGCFVEPYTDKVFIIQWNSTCLGFNEFIRVAPKTVCQCTGAADKNGKRIWENDIVKNDSGNIYKAFWQDQYYQFSWVCVKSDSLPIGTKWDLWSLLRYGDLEVIGSVFDDPKLLEVEE